MAKCSCSQHFLRNRKGELRKITNGLFLLRLRRSYKISYMVPHAVNEHRELIAIIVVLITNSTTTSGMTATLLHKLSSTLGEGAFWHSTRQSFFWVDIEGKTLYEHTAMGKLASWGSPYRISMVAQSYQEDVLVLAMQGRIMKFDLKSGALSLVVKLEIDKPENRCNDGGVDVTGRLWIGTMSMQFHEGSGSLYCIDRDQPVSKKIQGLTVPNGLAWSPDGKRMYHVDSNSRKVACYSFDPGMGTIAFKKNVLQVPRNMGSPDGMCMDEEGMLWIAHWNGSSVCRWNPADGALLSKIEVPVPQVSCCAFGGENMDQLLITTARQNMSAADLEKYPDSGSVYMAEPGVRGIKKHLCNL
jgi:sugar lactone lactonase YvrE